MDKESLLKTDYKDSEFSTYRKKQKLSQKVDEIETELNKSKKENSKLNKDLEKEKLSHVHDRHEFRKMFQKQEQTFHGLKKENKDLRKKIAMNDQINREIIDDLIQTDKTNERSESEKSVDEETESVDMDTEAFMCNICYNSVSRNLRTAWTGT